MVSSLDDLAGCRLEDPPQFGSYGLTLLLMEFCEKSLLLPLQFKSPLISNGFRMGTSPWGLDDARSSLLATPATVELLGFRQRPRFLGVLTTPATVTLLATHVTVELVPAAVGPDAVSAMIGLVDCVSMSGGLCSVVSGEWE